MRYRTKSSATKPRGPHSAGRANTAESTPSRPLCSTARVRVHSRVDAVRWCPSMHCVDTWIPPCLAHHLDVGIQTMPNSHALHVTPIAAVPLRRVSARSLCRRAEPSPPFLSPGTARIASMQCTTIKGGPPITSCWRHHPCPPLISHHHHAHLYFLPRRRCQATSPLLSPRALVQELCQSSELHPDRRTDTFTGVELWCRLPC
jgi:hypothetical protein